MELIYSFYRSAPEQKDVFTLHIRGLGGWTKRLYAYFQSEEQLMRLENGGVNQTQFQTFKKR